MIISNESRMEANKPAIVPARAAVLCNFDGKAPGAERGDGGRDARPVSAFCSCQAQPVLAVHTRSTTMTANWSKRNREPAFCRGLATQVFQCPRLLSSCPALSMSMAVTCPRQRRRTRLRPRLLFGDGVYEVTAVLDGRLVDSSAHLARLDRSLREIALAAAER